MKNKTLCILLATAMYAVCYTNDSKGQQGRTTAGIHYNYSIPAGSFKSDVTDKGSAKGVFADILYNVTDRLAVGGLVGYQDYYQKFPRMVYKTSDGSDISAVRINSVQTTPLMAKANYKFLDQGIVQPYVEAGAGVNFLSFRQYLGEFTNTSDATVKLTALAGAGIFIPVNKNATGIRIGGTYQYVPYNKNGISNFNSYNIYAGVAFPIR
jgi:hypothetical protein